MASSSTADGQAGDGVASPELHMLLPVYDADRHKPYVDMLRAAIDGREAKNIALAGQYSSGKSSVLAGLEANLEGTKLKPITLSLSTIDAEAARVRAGEPPPDAAANSGAAGIRPVTSLIQNEIVKQLLYRKRPSKVPDSRFRRAEAFLPARAGAWSLVVAAAVGAAVLVWPEANQLVKGISLALAAGAGSYLLQRRFRGRVTLQQLTAGPATLTLDTTRSYFDEYLDEIIYFFDVSRCRVVIFEDIDRFDDPQIFETLRELNTLLNAAEQLTDKAAGPVRFIYATRDSIFELGNQPAGDQAPGAPNSPAADRTKFFDVVVPLVPFVTHRTSRDHFTKRLSGSTVSPHVIGIVSRYVTDMRLIINICNEFEVFRSVVLNTVGLGHLKTDNLFAMVVYKNLYPGDFEAITSGQSRLDLVYASYRAIVNESAAALERKIGDLRTSRRLAESVNDHLHEAAERLTEIIDTISLATTGRETAVTLAVGSTSFTMPDLKEPTFWEAVGASAEGSSVQVSIPGWSTLALRRESIEKAFRRPLPQESLNDALRPEVDAEIATLEREWETIRAAGIADLFNHHNLLRNDEAIDFATVVATSVQWPLALALLKAGYLDEHFAFYVADYPAHRMSTGAAEFELTVIERYGSDHRFRIPDPATDVPALIQSAGDEFLHDSRGYNLDILNYLLTEAPSQTEGIFTSLAQGRVPDVAFIDAYVAGGRHQVRFIQALAARWDRTFVYLTDATGTQDRDTELLWLGAALANADTAVNYETSPRVQTTLELAAEELYVLTHPTAADPEKTAEVAAQLEVSYPNIAPFTDDMRAAVVRAQCFRVNRDNLRSLVPSLPVHTPSLDEIQDSQGDTPALDHLLANLDDYVEVLKQEPAALAVADPAKFPAFVDLIAENYDFARRDDADAELLFTRAHPAARIEDITDAPHEAWRALVKAGRCSPTVANIHRYLEDYVDGDDWQPLIQGLDALPGAEHQDEQTKQRVALAVLALGNLDVSRRISLVKALALETSLPPDELGAAATELIPDLITAGLIEDSAEAFARIPVDRQGLRTAYFAASTRLSAYVESLDLGAGDVGPILATGDTVAIQTVLSRPALLEQIGSDTATQAIHAALQTTTILPAGSVVALAGSGAPILQFAPLLVRHLPHLNHTQLRQVLDAMSGPYHDLGTVVTEVPEQDQELVKALKDVGVVSEVKKVYGKPKLRVSP